MIRQLLFLAPLLASVPGLADTQPWFVDVAAEKEVSFLHVDGRSGHRYYIETTASGGGLFDYDGDGDIDLYLVNGASTPGRTLEPRPRNALYENRGGRFVDRSRESGVDDDGYGMGVCVGDIDADGHIDLMVTNFGPDRLYRNLGDGRFEEIGQAAGVADRRWSGSCAFGDVDGDGDLDLFVTHYVDFDFLRNPSCGTEARPAYCLPEAFEGVPDSLFLNDGTGRFDEVGVSWGLIQGPSEKGMGVRLLDIEPDGDLDAFVANDGSTNRLYLNQGERFEDFGLGSGVGLNQLGNPEASMGVAVGDSDGDGDTDLYVTHFAMETNTLYRNLGDLFFEDASRPSGAGKATLLQVGWGTEFFDYDNDGDLDLAVVNGHIQDGIERDEPLFSYAQVNTLFENLGDGSFRDRTAQAGKDFGTRRVSRGLAVGDWNDDGRLDLLVTNTNAAPNLLENRVVNDHRWLGLRLRGAAGNPFAIGARVRLRAGALQQVRTVSSGGSFQTQSDLRLHFGVGTFRGRVDLVIEWPDGAVQRESTDQLNRYWTIERADDLRTTTAAE